MGPFRVPSLGRMDSLDAVRRDICDCRQCPRLVEWREQVAVERGVVGEVGRQIPVVPAVVSAHNNFIFRRSCARRSNCNRINFSSSSCKFNLFRPRMYFYQFFGQ